MWLSLLVNMHSNKMRAGVSLTAALLTQGVSAGSRCCQPVSRDVAIIGGGASGSHAAVWLRDQGKSVVVVEKASQLVSKFLHVSVTAPSGVVSIDAVAVTDS